MSDGRGCWCCAAGPFECVCDADWTPQEIYDQQKRIAELEAQIGDLLERYEKAKDRAESYRNALTHACGVENLLAEQEAEIERLTKVRQSDADYAWKQLITIKRLRDNETHVISLLESLETTLCTGEYNVRVANTLALLAEMLANTSKALKEVE